MKALQAIKSLWARSRTAIGRSLKRAVSRLTGVVAEVKTGNLTVRLMDDGMVMITDGSSWDALPITLVSPELQAKLAESANDALCDGGPQSVESK